MLLRFTENEKECKLFSIYLSEKNVLTLTENVLSWDSKRFSFFFLACLYFQFFPYGACITLRFFKKWVSFFFLNLSAADSLLRWGGEPLRDVQRHPWPLPTRCQPQPHSCKNKKNVSRQLPHVPAGEGGKSAYLKATILRGGQDGRGAGDLNFVWSPEFR